MDFSTVDVSGTITAIMAIIMAVGGVVGKRYITKALEGVSDVSDVLVDVGQLLISISVAGRDDVLTPEEWGEIKAMAGHIKDELLAIQGKFGSSLKQ